MTEQGTLLLRLAGPLQSWGTQSRFRERDTDREPSKSGVIGLICAALGRPRSVPVDDLAALRMGVRVDVEGYVKRDFQTAGGTHRRGDHYGVAMIDGKHSGTVPSNRNYLAGADFLVGLSGDFGLLSAVQESLRMPHWQLFLGRKAYVPGVPVYLPDGLRAGVSLEASLRAEPWPGLSTEVPLESQRPRQLRLIIESDEEGIGQERYDQPIGMAYQNRTFSTRRVITDFLSVGGTVPIRGEVES